MGESASARTQRELAELRGAIERDVDALKARVRDDADPRNLVRRQPLAVIGSLGSLAAAVALGLVRRAREKSRMEGQVDAVVERLGGRIDRLRGKARKEFRKRLRKEMAETSASGPKEAAYGALTAALTALAMTVARGFARRLAGDEPREREL